MYRRVCTVRKRFPRRPATPLRRRRGHYCVPALPRARTPAGIWRHSHRGRVCRGRPARVRQANLLRTSARPQEAVQIGRQAIDFYDKLAAKHPNELNVKLELAKRYASLGAVLRDTGKPKEAAEIYRRAVGEYQALLAALPRDPEYRRRLISNYQALMDPLWPRRESALSLRCGGQTPSDTEYFDGSHSLLVRLRFRRPDNVNHRRRRQRYHRRAQLQRRSNGDRGALRTADDTQSRQQRLPGQHYRSGRRCESIQLLAGPN